MQQSRQASPDDRPDDPDRDRATGPGHADVFVDGAGPVSRSLEPRFVSMPAPLPLLTIVVVGYIGMVAVLVGVGELIVHLGMLAAVRDWDDSLTRWMADRRTGVLDGVTAQLTRAADTMGVVLIALVVEIVLLVQRRWWALLIAPIALGLELSTFLSVNAVVGRPRPDVPRLGSEPSTSSFPSGHTAATFVIWGTIALLFCAPSSYRWVRTTAYTIVVVFAVAVGTGRVYRGMHHPTDVMVGAMMGFAALSITVIAVRVTALAVQDRQRGSDEAPATPGRRRVPAVPA
jgi:undecaprenyl-diphosphatase